MDNINKFIHQFKIMLINLDVLFFTYKKRKRGIILLKQKELSYKETLFELIFNKQNKRKKIQEDIMNLNNEIYMYDNYFFDFRRMANKYIFEYIEKYVNDYSLTDNEYKKSFQCLKNIYMELTNKKDININKLKQSSNIFLKYIKNVSEPKHKPKVDVNLPNIIKIKHVSIKEKYDGMEKILFNMYGFENHDHYCLKKNTIPILFPSEKMNKFLNKELLFKKCNVRDRHKEYITYCGLSLDDDVKLYEKYYNMIPLIFRNEGKSSIFKSISESSIFSDVNVHSLFKYYYYGKNKYGKYIDLFKFLEQEKKQEQEQEKNKESNEWTALSVINSINVGYRCHCCGKLSFFNNKITSTLNAHEMWEMELDKDKRIFQKTLKRIISLCDNCHKVFHGKNWNNKDINEYEYEYVKEIIGCPNIIEKDEIDKSKCQIKIIGQSNFIKKDKIDESKYQIKIDATKIIDEDCLKNSIYLDNFKKIISFQGNNYKPKFIEEVLEDHEEHYIGMNM